MKISDIICGVDEAGRGPWAGPVCAGAVILDPSKPIEGLNDSKKLSEKKRNLLATLIYENALAWGLGWASPEEIDTLNIRQANHLAMRRAVDALKVVPTLALVDGNDAPPLACRVETLVGGDGIEACISAASILAKTARDAKMIEYDDLYPEYGFAKHKGYGVKAHSEALTKLGPCPIHRMSFKPVIAAKLGTFTKV